MTGRAFESLAERVVVVNGAASRIGSATAVAFAKAGARLALCDIDEERLDHAARRAEAAGARSVYAETVDVSKAEAVRRFAEHVAAQLGTVDVLVNNAGVVLEGGFLHTSLDDWKWVTGTNLWGVVHTCHFFLPSMVARQQGGHVVNIASAAGFINSEALCAYGTSKYAVVGLSEALRDELRAHHIGVSVVCPGFVTRALFKRRRARADDEPAAVRQRAVAWYRKRDLPPERVADAVLDAVRGNHALVPVAAEAWGLYALKRLVPGALPRLVRSLGQRFGPGDGK